MRRTPVGGLLHLGRELEQPLDQRARRGVEPLLAVGQLRGHRGGHPLLPRLAQDRGDPRVRVLHVVGGVVLSLAARQLEVELDRGVVAARGEVPARGIHPDVVHERVERDDRALALRHLRALAALEQVDELHHHDLVGARIAAERGPGGVDPLHVAVVVGPEHVDQPVVSARELVGVVGDVRREVRQLAGRAAQHAVLVVAGGRGAQPQRTVRLVDALELVQGPLHGSRLEQRALREEAIHVHAEALERRLDLLQHQLDPALGELVGIGVGGAGDALRQAGDVVALVLLRLARRGPAPGSPRRTCAPACPRR